MSLFAATRLTMTDVFIISMVMKFFLLGMVGWMFSVIKRDERRARPEPAHLLETVAPTKRVAVVACPFCEAEHTASVRMERVGDDAVYELICWNCRAALPDTALVTVVEPGAWLARTQVAGHEANVERKERA